MKDWQELSQNALQIMQELGNFTPTSNFHLGEIKGYTYDDNGEGFKTYWNTEDLCKIASACLEVREWLLERKQQCTLS